MVKVSPDGKLIDEWHLFGASAGKKQGPEGRRRCNRWLAPLAILAALWPSLVFGQASQTPSIEQASQTPSIEDVAQRLESECRTGKFWGVVIARKDGKTVLERVCGYSDVSAKTVMTERTRFKLFSISKSFTGTAIMALVDHGLMKIDDPLRQYLPEIPPSWNKVTIKELLQHTSGIPDLTNQLDEAFLANPAGGHPVALRYVLSHLTDAQQALPKEPGQVWKYNNFGYELLAAAAAFATKKPFDEVLQKFVFTPGGMKTAEIARPLIVDGKLKGSVKSPGLAIGYNGEPGKLVPAESRSFVQLGAGAVYASAEDLFSFDEAMRDGRIISKSIQDLNVAAAFPVNDRVRYGFGWMIRTANGRQYLQHSGGNNGYESEFARATDGQTTVVVLSNLGFAEVSKIRADLMAALLPAFSAPEQTPSTSFSTAPSGPR